MSCINLVIMYVVEIVDKTLTIRYPLPGNTALVYHHGKLMALSEADKPCKLIFSHHFNCQEAYMFHFFPPSLVSLLTPPHDEIVGLFIFLQEIIEKSNIIIACICYGTQILLWLSEDVLKVLEDGDLQTLGLLDYDKRLTHSFTAHPKVDPFTGKNQLQEKAI